MDELRKRQKIISQLVEGGWESSVPGSTAWKVGHRTPRLI